MYGHILIYSSTIDSVQYGKRLMTDGKTVASFRVDMATWKRFGELAKRERLNATQILIDYIDKCILLGHSMYEVEPEDFQRLMNERVPTRRDVYRTVGKHIKPISIDVAEDDIGMEIDATAAVNELDEMKRKMEQQREEVNEALDRQRSELLEAIEGIKKPLPIAA